METVTPVNFISAFRSLKINTSIDGVKLQNHLYDYNYKENQKRRDQFKDIFTKNEEHHKRTPPLQPANQNLKELKKVIEHLRPVSLRDNDTSEIK